MRLTVTLLVLILACSLCLADESKPDVYSATAVYSSGPSGTIPVKIYIKSYTSDEEVVQLANLLKNEGPDPVLKAINKIERGRLAPVRKTGTDVGVVRIRPTENGNRITMVMERPVAFLELMRSTRSSDYPFGIVQLDLDKSGKGSGVLIVSARIKFTADNTIEVESYGMEPMRLLHVKKLN